MLGGCCNPVKWLCRHGASDVYPEVASGDFSGFEPSFAPMELRLPLRSLNEGREGHACFWFGEMKKPDWLLAYEIVELFPR